ncbi:MATE family efflux transporter [Selenomonas ruminantium]|uniref:MATE family efflux transporter n=1 Tax=Selenomonas ruminantium TaxID=971 RepID=UPI002113DB6D|nr:MATE family efflux transporter [Selenomonas ruminantium]
MPGGEINRQNKELLKAAQDYLDANADDIPDLKDLPNLEDAGTVTRYLVDSSLNSSSSMVFVERHEDAVEALIVELHELDERITNFDDVIKSLEADFQRFPILLDSIEYHSPEEYAPGDEPLFISEIGAMAVFARWMFSVSQTLKPKFYCSFSDTLKVLNLSYVNASISLYIAVGNMILVIYFLRNFGQDYFPVLSAVISIFQLAVCLSGVEKATEPLVNIYLGENNFDGVIKIMKPAAIVAAFFGGAVIPVMWLFCEPIASIFGIADVAIVAEAKIVIRTVAFAMPFVALLYLFTMYYQINGYFKIAISLSFCKDLLLYTGLPILFSSFIGVRGVWLGMVAVPFGTFLLFTIVLRIRYPETFPLLVSNKDIVSQDEVLNICNVIKLRDWAEGEFQKRGFSSRYVMKVGLLVEEIGMSVVEKNLGTNILAELTLFFDGEPKIILRDNGIHFDMTQDNLSSFRDYFLYSLLTEENIGKNFLETQNYNRHIFRPVLKNKGG